MISLSKRKNENGGELSQKQIYNYRGKFIHNTLLFHIVKSHMNNQKMSLESKYKTTPPHKDPLFWIILFCVGMMMLIAIARNGAVKEVQAPTSNQQVINDARKLTEEINALVLQDPIEEQPQIKEFPLVYNAS